VTTSNALIHGVPLVDLPTVLLQNEQVLSDAENFSERYRQLGLGPVVGTPTAAFNAGSRGYSLFTGVRVSVGAWRALSATGENMDRVSRQPDVYVDRPIGEGLTDRDRQLEASVRVLLQRIDGGGDRRE
jgi:tricorn protease